ncbi:MAG TPA: hypothetical protein VGS79_15040 [Puia sp.]|nr:hypothetical protein [Puia sp.]
MIIPDYDSETSDIPITKPIRFSYQTNEHEACDGQNHGQAFPYTYFMCRPYAGQQRPGVTIDQQGKQKQEMNFEQIEKRHSNGNCHQAMCEEGQG